MSVTLLRNLSLDCVLRTRVRTAKRAQNGKNRPFSGFGTQWDALEKSFASLGHQIRIDTAPRRCQLAHAISVGFSLREQDCSARQVATWCPAEPAVTHCHQRVVPALMPTTQCADQCSSSAAVRWRRTWASRRPRTSSAAGLPVQMWSLCRCAFPAPLVSNPPATFAVDFLFAPVSSLTQGCCRAHCWVGSTMSLSLISQRSCVGVGPAWAPNRWLVTLKCGCAGRHGRDPCALHEAKQQRWLCAVSR